YVRLSKNGHVVTYRFKQRSSNEQFNDSIDRLLRKFETSGGGKSLPLPEDEKAKKVVLQEGLNLKNWEVTQR
ncbi:MAG: TonB C-terminal domain-containing protein, partial [Bradymonadaceae bacterium]